MKKSLVTLSCVTALAIISVQQVPSNVFADETQLVNYVNKDVEVFDGSIYEGEPAPKLKSTQNILKDHVTEIQQAPSMKYIHGDGSDMRNVNHDGKLQAPVVLILFEKNNGSISALSGAFVGNRTILTCAHGLLTNQGGNSFDDVVSMKLVIGSNSAVNYGVAGQPGSYSGTSGWTIDLPKDKVKFFNQQGFSSRPSDGKGTGISWHNDITAIQTDFNISLFLKSKGYKNTDFLFLPDGPQTSFQSGKTLQFNGYPAPIGPSNVDYQKLKQQIVHGKLYNGTTNRTNNRGTIRYNDGSVSNNQIEYDQSVIGGFSGSTMTDENGTVIGVLQYALDGDGGHGGGTLLDQTTLDWIKGKVKENQQTGWAQVQGSSDRYYFDANNGGHFLKNTTRNIGDRKYQFANDGKATDVGPAYTAPNLNDLKSAREASRSTVDEAAKLPLAEIDQYADQNLANRLKAAKTNLDTIVKDADALIAMKEADMEAANLQQSRVDQSKNDLNAKVEEMKKVLEDFKNAKTKELEKLNSSISKASEALKLEGFNASDANKDQSLADKVNKAKDALSKQVESANSVKAKAPMFKTSETDTSKIDAATKDLTDAFNAWKASKVEADKTNLTKAIDLAEKSLDFKADKTYTADSKKSFEDAKSALANALAKSKEVAKSEIVKSDQSKVDESAKTLVDARNAFELAKSKLTEVTKTSIDTKKDDVKKDETKPSTDVKKDEVKKDETKPSTDLKKDDVKTTPSTDVKKDEVKTTPSTDVKKDEVKKDEVKKDEVKKDEVKKDEVKTKPSTDVKKDDVKTTPSIESKKDEVKKDEVKKDEVKKDEVKKDEVKKDDSIGSSKKDEVKKVESIKSSSDSKEDKKTDETKSSSDEDKKTESIESSKKDEAKKDESKKDEVEKDEVKKTSNSSSADQSSKSNKSTSSKYADTNEADSATAKIFGSIGLSAVIAAVSAFILNRKKSTKE